MREWDLDDLAGIGDLARERGIGVTAACNWRRHPDFPRPLIILSTGPIYSRAEVAAWHDGRWPDSGKVRRAPGDAPRLPNRYDHITTDLRSRIQAGEWAPGDRLPSRVELGRHYGISAVAMSYPMAELMREGLVVSARGSGTFVAFVQQP